MTHDEIRELIADHIRLGEDGNPWEIPAYLFDLLNTVDRPPFDEPQSRPNDVLSDGIGIIEDNPPYHGRAIEQVSSGRLQAVQDPPRRFSPQKSARCPDSL